MSRDLIDRNELIAELERREKQDPWRKCRGPIERWVRRFGYDILILTVKYFPNVDAENVVYCKDCVNGKKCPASKNVICTRHEHKGLLMRYSEDDFCSYGVRRGK